MAVRLETTIRRYIGASTDEKPIYEDAVSRDPVPNGSSFLEHDTGELYRLNWPVWNKINPDDTSEVITQLREVNQRLEAFSEQLVLIVNKL